MRIQKLFSESRLVEAKVKQFIERLSAIDSSIPINVAKVKCYEREILSYYQEYQRLHDAIMNAIPRERFEELDEEYWRFDDIHTEACFLVETLFESCPATSMPQHDPFNSNSAPRWCIPLRESRPKITSTEQAVPIPDVMEKPCTPLPAEVPLEHLPPTIQSDEMKPIINPIKCEEPSRFIDPTEKIIVSKSITPSEQSVVVQQYSFEEEPTHGETILTTHRDEPIQHLSESAEKSLKDYRIDKVPPKLADNKINLPSCNTCIEETSTAASSHSSEVHAPTGTRPVISSLPEPTPFPTSFPPTGKRPVSKPISTSIELQPLPTITGVHPVPKPTGMPPVPQFIYPSKTKSPMSAKIRSAFQPLQQFPSSSTAGRYAPFKSLRRIVTAVMSFPAFQSSIPKVPESIPLPTAAGIRPALKSSRLQPVSRRERSSRDVVVPRPSQPEEDPPPTCPNIAVWKTFSREKPPDERSMRSQVLSS